MANGNLLNKFSCGVAIMQAPFFALAHGMAPILNQQQDGWSDIYEIMVLVAGAFYFVMGLVLLRKLLLNYFNDFYVAIALLTVYFGTNAILYTTAQAGMSHAYSFFLFAAFMLLTCKWYDKPTLLKTAGLGIVAGLIFLIRPTNAISFLFFIGYDVYTKDLLKARIKFLTQNLKSIFLLALVAVAVMIPQWIIWKNISGSYFFYSYIGESFFFLQPQFFSSLFSYRNGWLIYSPLAALGLAGLFLLKKYARPVATVFPIIIVLMLYVITSWWCWWYVGFGNRAFVEMQALLAFGYAALFTWLSQKNRWLSYLLYVVCFFGFYLNSFQCHQYKYGLIHWDAMTADAYKAIFLQDSKPPGYDYLLSAPDYQQTLVKREPFFYQ